MINILASTLRRLMPQPPVTVPASEALAKSRASAEPEPYAASDETPIREPSSAVRLLKPPTTRLAKPPTARFDQPVDQTLAAPRYTPTPGAQPMLPSDPAQWLPLITEEFQRRGDRPEQWRIHEIVETGVDHVGVNLRLSFYPANSATLQHLHIVVSRGRILKIGSG